MSTLLPNICKVNPKHLLKNYSEVYSAFWLISLLIFLFKDLFLRNNLNSHVRNLENRQVKVYLNLYVLNKNS